MGNYGNSNGKSCVHKTLGGAVVTPVGGAAVTAVRDVTMAHGGEAREM